MKKIQQSVVIRFAKWLEAALMTVPFAAVWYCFYAERVSQPFYRWGNYLVIALFLVLVCHLGNVYEAFAISIKRISELVYSQALTVLASNGIMLVIIWLLSKRFPVVWPMLLAYLVEVLISVVCAFVSHHLYFRIFPARITAIVYDAKRGMDRLINEYGLDKKYNVQKKLRIETCTENLHVLDGMQTVFISGVHSKDRNVVLKYCMYHDIEVLVIPRIGDVIMSGANSIHMFHLPMLQVCRYDATPEYLFIKRVMDIVISLAACIVLSPLMLGIAAAIKACDHGPVLYKQVRLTKDGKKFTMHKFRSMRVDAEKDGVARLSTGEHDSRITPVGRVLRKLRMDELPQLLDILSGNLSLVGPRPERPEIAEQYMKELPEFQLRLEAKAGLTGYAQVYGRYNTTPYDKLQMDLMYIAHPSILEDLKIIMATVKILFMSDSTQGVQEEQITAMK